MSRLAFVGAGEGPVWGKSDDLDVAAQAPVDLDAEPQLRLNAYGPGQLCVLSPPCGCESPEL